VLDKPGLSRLPERISRSTTCEFDRGGWIGLDLSLLESNININATVAEVFGESFFDQAGTGWQR